MQQNVDSRLNCQKLSHSVNDLKRTNYPSRWWVSYSHHQGRIIHACSSTHVNQILFLCLYHDGFIFLMKEKYVPGLGSGFRVFNFMFHTCLYRVSSFRCMWKSFWWMSQSPVNQGRFSCTFTNLWIWWRVYILFVMLVTIEWCFPYPNCGCRLRKSY